MSRLSVLLVHGFGGGARDYRALKRHLLKRGHPVDFYEFFYEKRFGQVSLTEVADELAGYIETHLGDKSFSAIGLSQGGLIVRSLLARHTQLAEKIDSIVTVCTPHHGSLLAFLAFGKGAVDLRPNSTFLRNLKEPKVGIKYYAIYNPFDPVVIPGVSARLETAVINLRVAHFSHFLTFINSKTLNFIEKVLLQKV